VVIVGVLSAGAAYGVTTTLVGSGTISASANSAHVWLGMDVTGSPLGIVVTDVVPGGPAAKAGLQPGDLITSVNSQPVSTVDAVNAALIGLSSGDIISLQFTRGLTTYTTQATLAAQPPGSP
jgi:putative serine protease PepD